MFGNFAPHPQQDAALARVEADVRQRFRLTAQATVMVTELVCALPGCPPLETVITFWLDSSDGNDGNQAQRHHYKVFKPVQQVTEADLPPWWMKDALASPPDWVCACC
jgi:hypothetical protein